MTKYCGEYTLYPQFYVYQTNGTSLNFDSSNINTNSFTWAIYQNNIFKPVKYVTFLALIDLNKTYPFNASIVFQSSKNISNLYYFLINFKNNNLYKEFLYKNNTITDYGSVATINNSTPIYINVTLLPNSAYNSYLEFNIVYYTGGVYVSYILNITIINHFQYWKLN